MEKKQQLPPPPDEERCCHASGKGWRCKNFRMSYDSVPKSKHCEKHYNYYAEYDKKRKKRCGDGAGAGPDLDMERKKQLLPPPDEERCCHANGKGWRCKNFRMSYGSAAADDDARVPKTSRCKKHYNYFAQYKKKKTSGDGEGSGPDLEKQLPPDEERCCHTGGGNGITYRCKNFRMSHGADDDSVPKTKRCEKHYNYFAEYFKYLKKKKRNGDGEETRGSKRRREKKVMEEEDDDTSADMQGGSANVGTKRNKVETTEWSGRLDFRDFLIEKPSLITSNKMKKKSSGNGDTIVAGGSAKIGAKRKHVERTQGSGELKSLTKTVVETRTSKGWKIVNEGDRFVAEASNQPATDDNSDSDTIIEGGSADNVGKRKYVERMSGELESLTGSREPVVELETLEHYKTNCIELSVDHEKKELDLEKKGLELETMSVDLEKKIVECTKLHGKVVEVETRKTTATDETEQRNIDMDMLGMHNWNRNHNEEMKWKSEPDMLSSFEKDTELCMKAVCALYRQEISEDGISAKGLFFDSDTLRCTALAKFLMAEDCKGDVKKSVNDLEIFDSEAIVDCKRLARRYSTQLFHIYQNGKDPFFLPSSTSCHGNQTAK